jgi:nitroreductase
MTDLTPGLAPSSDSPPAAASTVAEALLTRRSVRAFLPTPVPRDLIERLLVLAARSASNSNCQPWHVHVLSGEPKRRLTEDLWRALDANRGVAVREYPYQPSPGSWPEPFRSRRHCFGHGLYRDTLGIDATDTGGAWPTTGATTTSSARRSG